ncbi:autoinducer binding domain-containing protein [Microvirga sp. 2MCAF35]|uniref:autoinducer binding domain-containing protein n=1 Tax=Microvirga sp. 2MCAF35 TaxID=3232987 RepID=UPI003F9EB203
MSSQDAIFQDFTDALWTANDEVALRNVAHRAASSLGFKWFAYLGLHENETVWISNYPRNWIERYFEQGYEAIDPIVVNARKQKRAFAWDSEKRAGGHSSEQARFFKEARDFNIGSGLTIPIRSGSGQITALTLANDGRLIEAEKVLSAAHEMVELMGLYYHARVAASLKASRVHAEVQLSQREVQCLTWAARGKTVAETADILGVTARTVTFHQEHARAKLGAGNITQAVAIALRRGLIR